MGGDFFDSHCIPSNQFHLETSTTELPILPRQNIVRHVRDAWCVVRSEVWRQSSTYVVRELLTTRVVFTLLLGVAALELIVSFILRTQVLFSKLICTATIKSSRIVRYSDTNNIQSSHHRQADVRSQRLERLHQSLQSSAYWRSHSPGKTLRLLWLWFTTVWWTVRQCWRTTIWQFTKKLSPYLT